MALARKGAHDPANLQPVDLELTERLVGSGMVRVMTLAPELPRAKEAIRLLRDGGVVASAGHTEASYEEMLRAIDSGLPMGTHLYSDGCRNYRKKYSKRSGKGLSATAMRSTWW
ncbi:MAG: hypothetical protein H0W79_08785, partial [Rubrobacteraceae bacterium]|nr:hypothetical protein [Rubrobacteraceae bacterium]